MIQEKSWEITDEFWAKTKELLIKISRDPNKTYKRAEGGGRKPLDFRIVLSAIFYVLRTGIQWKALPQKSSVPQGQSANTLNFGRNKAFL